MIIWPIIYWIFAAVFIFNTFFITHATTTSQRTSVFWQIGMRNQSTCCFVIFYPEKIFKWNLTKLELKIAKAMIFSWNLNLPTLNHNESISNCPKQHLKVLWQIIKLILIRVIWAFFPTSAASEMKNREWSRFFLYKLDKISSTIFIKEFMQKKINFNS